MLEMTDRAFRNRLGDGHSADVYYSDEDGIHVAEVERMGMTARRQPGRSLSDVIRNDAREQRTNETWHWNDATQSWRLMEIEDLEVDW